MRSHIAFRSGHLCAALCVSLSALAIVTHAQSEPADTTPFPAKGTVSSASRISLYIDGVERYYLVQPASGKGLHPVVVLLHGGTETAEQVWRQTSLPTLAAKNNFVMVAPNAVGRHWNDGRGAVLAGKASTADDIDFLQTVVQNVLRDLHGDPQAVFMVGASNGGFMTMNFACSGVFPLRAAANAISDLPAAQQQNCNAPPMPWLSMNGTDDPLVPFNGMDEGTIVRGQRQPALLSADDTFRFFALRAECKPILSGTRLPHRETADPTYAEVRSCIGANGKASIQYVFHGAGHSMPNQQYGPLVRKIVGRSNQDVDAGEVLWNFFKSTL